MDLDKQIIILEMLLSNSELFAKCNAIIKPDYFDPMLRRAVAYSQDYFEKFHAIPTSSVIKAETKLEIPNVPLEKHEYHYVATEIEDFCRFRAAELELYKGPEYLEKGDMATFLENMKIVNQISLNRDLGISYFADPKSRLEDLLTNNPVIPTGWDEVNEMIDGVSRQELVLFAANSGIGKSIVMSNLAIDLVKQGYNGVYISLELADRVVGKRFDSMTTGFAQRDILDNINKVVEGVERFKSEGIVGDLYIKRLPESTTTANHIRAYLQEFLNTVGYTPDFIIIDYLDLMASNRNVSSENIFLKDKYVAEEVRAIGFDYNCAIITASQLGRGALEADKVSQGHIQGGVSKVQTCDIMISIIQTDLMRAAGEYIFEFTKTRNSGGVGKAVLLRWDPIALRVTNNDNTSNKEEIQSLKKTEPLHIGGTVFDKSSDKLLSLIKR
jgi:archaellum biogenesis ATPase FlaH